MEKLLESEWYEPNPLFDERAAYPCKTNMTSVFPNIRISYLYRDASNYKRYKDIVLPNPQKVPAYKLWLDIQGALQETSHFYGELVFHPEWVGLPTVFLCSLPEYSKNEDDHDVHELCSVEETVDPVSREIEMTTDEFFDALLNTHSRVI